MFTPVGLCVHVRVQQCQVCATALYVLPTCADLPPTHVSWPLPMASQPPALTNASQPPWTHHDPHGCAMAPTDAY